MPSADGGQLCHGSRRSNGLRPSRGQRAFQVLSVGGRQRNTPKWRVPTAWWGGRVASNSGSVPEKPGVGEGGVSVAAAGDICNGSRVCAARRQRETCTTLKPLGPQTAERGGTDRENRLGPRSLAGAWPLRGSRTFAGFIVSYKSWHLAARTLTRRAVDHECALLLPQPALVRFGQIWVVFNQEIGGFGLTWTNFGRVGQTVMGSTSFGFDQIWEGATKSGWVRPSPGVRPVQPSVGLFDQAWGDFV